MDKKTPYQGISRRQFLKNVGVGAAVGASTVIASSDAKGFSILRTDEAPSPEQSIPTICEVCFWNCGIIAHTRKNRILELQGHPDYPNARGKLCGRGNAGVGFVRDPDRLKYPMRRIGKRGEGKFERIGWSMAYKIIAENFAKIKEKYGAQSLGLFYHGKGGPLYRKLWVANGSPNYAAPAYAQCKGPRDVAFKHTFGTKLPSPEPLDFENTKCMVFFGSHLGENAHNSQVQDFVKARSRGAHLIVLDPRMSTAASKADIWMSLEPGTDLAIILAWIHLLIKNKDYDHQYVSTHCTGFSELKSHVEQYTPQWAASVSNVPVSKIMKAYALIVQSKPAVLIHPGRHVTWYGEMDSQRARGQAILTALLGAWWQPGGIFRPSSPELGDYPGPDYPDLPPNVDQAANRYPLASECSTTGLRDATRTGKPYPIKGWFVYASNLIQSMPNTQHTIEAINNLDFIAVTDVLPTEITQYADVLLPECTYLERYDDLAVGAGKKPYVGLRQPVVKSPYDTRPTLQVVKELSQVMGLGDFFAYSNPEDYLSTRLKPLGIDLQELKEKGIHFTKPKNSPYIKPNEPHTFHTHSGKIELYSQTLKDNGFDPLPVYKEPSPPPQGWMRLLYGRSPLHTFGRTQNNEILFDVAPSNCIWINPVCAKKMGLKHNTAVYVTNDQGLQTGPLPLKVTERVKEKTAYMVHGFGHRSKKMSLACCSGGSDSEVISNYAIDPITGATGMRVQFIQIKAAQPNAEVIPCATR